ncbi:MAG: sensor histidine kinase [Saprospiraceae bacterium]
MNRLLNKRFFGIAMWEYLIVAAIYTLFAVIYHLAIWISSIPHYDTMPWDKLFSFTSFMDAAGLCYILTLLTTIPIWWLIFRYWKSKPLKKKLLAHVFLLPLFIVISQESYRFICNIIGWTYLDGYGRVWDIYIPSLLYILQFGIFHAYTYYHDNQRNLKLKATLSEAALRSELSAIKAQLNPHFLYNVFNTISASVPPEQERTREMIAELSDLFRYQLKASQTDEVPLHEELSFVKKYLDLEKARFEERLQIKINVPKHLQERLVPPMLLQPLVENSVKHGISPLIEGGEVSIDIKEQNDGQLMFLIRDTGVGVTDKTKLFGKGVGLTNTKLRLEKQYGSILKISDNLPQGLRIEFAL